MSEEREKIGVDVWMAGTIYVDADTEEEAAQIVKERYAGTREKSFGLDLLDGEDIPIGDGDDFLSSAVSLYGVCHRSALVPAVDDVPNALYVLKEAADMIAILMAEEGRLVNVPALSVMNKIDLIVSQIEGRNHG